MEVGDSFDYYDILNVSQDAKLETITQAYKTLSRVHHPDKCSGSDTTFLKLKKAFDVLSDDTMRQFYDKYGPPGVHVAQLTDRSDELALPGDKLAVLEKNVRHLVRRHGELKEMRTTQLQGEFSMGFNLSVPRWETEAMRSVRRAGLRHQYGQQATSCAFNTRVGTITMASMAHVQNAGAGVIKYILSWQRQWTPATSSKVSISTSGQDYGSCDASVSHRVSRNLSLSQRIVWTRLSVASYFCSAAFDFGGGLSSQAGITLLPNGLNCQLTAAKSFGSTMSAKATVQTSKDDVSLAFRAQYAPSDRWSLSIGPTVASSRGSGVLVETEVNGVPDDLTSITWGLHLRQRSLTLVTKINRAGLSFALPLEVDSAGLTPHPECAALALFVFVTVPYLVTYLRREKPKSQTDAPDETLPGLPKMAEKRRREEEAVGGLVILQAVYGDGPLVEQWVRQWDDATEPREVLPLCDVTDALMHKVRDSKLMISGRGRKSGLIGFPRLDTANVRLGIRYRSGRTEATQSFDDSDAVHLP